MLTAYFLPQYRLFARWDPAQENAFTHDQEHVEIKKVFMRDTIVASEKQGFVSTTHYQGKARISPHPSHSLFFKLKLLGKHGDICLYGKTLECSEEGQAPINFDQRERSAH